MRDHSYWSISLGRWGGVQVQLHLFFLLFAAFTLYLSWLQSKQGHLVEPPAISSSAMSSPAVETAPENAKTVESPASQSAVDKPREVPKPASAAREAAERKRVSERNADREAANGQTNMAWAAIISLLLLFGSALIHELGRRYAANRVGGSLDTFVLWPLGGLGAVRAPHDPRSEVLIHLSGPAANLGAAAIFLLPLLIAQSAELPGLLHPLLPVGVTEGGIPAMTLKLGFWINWVLFLINLIPAFPFDGGRALRAGLLVQWPEIDRRAAAIIVARLAAVAAVLMLVAAWLVRRQPTQTQPAPAWFALVVLAIFLYFGGKQEVERRDDEHDDEDRPFGYDFSAGYTSLEKTARPAAPKQRKPGAIAQWRKKRREERERRQAEIEAADESRVDDILGRLHENGKDSLSDEDRAVLARVSARYRGRSEHRA